jgi:alcohol dehydrogenase
MSTWPFIILMYPRISIGVTVTAKDVCVFCWTHTGRSFNVPLTASTCVLMLSYLQSFFSPKSTHAASAPQLPSTMRAIQLVNSEGANKLELRTVNVPIIDKTEMLIAVRAASLNCVDFHMKNGIYRDSQGRKTNTPITLGRDCTGVVVAVGSLVNGFKVGDEVWACVPPECDGTFAEYAKVKFFWAAPKPKNFSFEACAALPFCAVTTIANLITKAPNPKMNRNVLILGASGGIGTFALQLCKKVYEDTVTAVCHKNNIQLCKENGVDKIAAYDDPEHLTFLLRRRLFDLVIDATPNGVLEETTRELVAKGGRLITFQDHIRPKWLETVNVGWKYFFWYTFENWKKRWRLSRHWDVQWKRVTFPWWRCGNYLSALTKHVEQKTIVPLTDKVFYFDDFEKAFQYAEDPTKKKFGKVVLKLPEKMWHEE